MRLKETARTRLGDAVLRAAATSARRQIGVSDPIALVIQPDHLGDIVLSTPAVRRMRADLPQHRLIALVGPWSAEITRLLWPVDEVRTLQFPAFQRDSRSATPSPFARLRMSTEEVAAINADRAFVMRPDDRWSAALAMAAGIPTIITGDDPRTRKFATTVAPTSAVAHRAAKALLIASAGTPAHLTSPTYVEYPLAIHLDNSGRCEHHRRYAVVHPGAGAPVKHWPQHRWRVVVEALLERGLDVFVTGSATEVAMCAEIVTGRSAVNLAGKTTLRELVEVLQQAAIAVGTDNGPMHLAVGLGAPTVGLFGPSNPREFGPWGSPSLHKVIHAGWKCPRCYDLSPTRAEGCGCMLAISPDSVVAAIDDLLA